MVAYEVDSVVLSVTDDVGVWHRHRGSGEHNIRGERPIRCQSLPTPLGDADWFLRTYTVAVVGDPNRATQASYWATGLLSMLPTTCCRHWLTVHSASATLNGTTTGILMNECKRAKATRYGTVRRGVKVNERGRRRAKVSGVGFRPVVFDYLSRLERCARG